MSPPAVPFRDHAVAREPAGVKVGAGESQSGEQEPEYEPRHLAPQAREVAEMKRIGRVRPAPVRRQAACPLVVEHLARAGVEMNLIRPIA